MWFAIYSGGVLSKFEFMDELRQNKICPLLVYKKEGKAIIPVFPTPELGMEFARRNTPKTDCIGVVNLLENDQQTLLNSGFEFESLEWPCKREVSVHVLFLEEELETIIKGVRKK